MSDKRTERIAQLRIELYDAKRERDELMASNVFLSQRNAALTSALLEMSMKLIQKDKIIGLMRPIIRDAASLIMAYIEVESVPLSALEDARKELLEILEMEP